MSFKQLRTLYYNIAPFTRFMREIMIICAAYGCNSRGGRDKVLFVVVVFFFQFSKRKKHAENLDGKRED